MAALALEIQNRVDHVFDHAGASDLPLFRDMPHKDDRNPAPFGECHQFMRRGADLTDRTGGGLDRIQPHGLNGIDDGKGRAFGIQRGQDVAQIGFRAKADRGILQAKALGAHPHLCGGLFARDIKAFQTVAGKTCSRLQQKRRFPDPRIAAHQNGRGRHKATTQHTVQLLNPGTCAGGRVLLCRQIGQRDAAPL